MSRPGTARAPRSHPGAGGLSASPGRAARSGRGGGAHGPRRAGRDRVAGRPRLANRTRGSSSTRAPDGPQTGRWRIARASRARARRGRELRARFAGRAASMGRGRTSRRRSRARVLGERWRVAGRWSEWRPRRRAGHRVPCSPLLLLPPPYLSLPKGTPTPKGSSTAPEESLWDPKGIVTAEDIRHMRNRFHPFQ